MRPRIRTSLTGLLCAALLAAPACKSDRAATRETAGGEVETGLRVTDVQLGRNVGADKRVAEETNDFRPNDVIYASVATAGAAQSATLTTRWTYENGQLVDEASQTVSPSGDAFTEFHISKPDGLPTGKYRVEVLLNGQSVATEEFEVKR